MNHEIVLDTNVLVSAVATRGLCADVFREVLTSRELIVSDALLKEVKKVLQQKFTVPPSLISEFLNLLKQDTIFIKPSGLPEVTIKDTSDLIIIASALSGSADLLVTGDKELLNLGNVENLEIVSPRVFWEKVKSQTE
jgi:putative PIN family toxin of toxin-antitoxin system